jgi:hypothetical protein
MPLSPQMPLSGHTTLQNDTPSSNQFWMSLLLPGLALAAFWIAVVWVVDPRGEFMVNDDWSFLRALERLMHEGRLGSTGWGPKEADGGPSLIVHLLWGRLFTSVFGYSLTVLRASVLVIGIAGSAALLVLLRATGLSRSAAVCGTLALTGNPLFLSQCFSYMSDVTFASLMIFALAWLHYAATRRAVWPLAIGLLFSLAGILARQIGVVVPIAFLCAVCVAPRSAWLGRMRAFLLVVGLVVVPWLTYEFALSYLGSTPLTAHPVVRNIFMNPAEKGLMDYAVFSVASVGVLIAYVGFFTSPVLVLRWDELWDFRAYRWFVAGMATAVAVLEVALLSGWVDIPVSFHRNVVFDFGVGPVLLKDVYFLGIMRGPTLPQTVYILIVGWAVLSAGGLLLTGTRWIRSTLFDRSPDRVDNPNGFIANLAGIAACGYAAIVVLTTFHDRYLMPLCILVLVWLVAGRASDRTRSLPWSRLAAGYALVTAVGLFSIWGVHDFMSMKRSLARAHDFVVKDLAIPPCSGDGGFEFNGYHCYEKGFSPIPGLSWWWVKQEAFLITLGPLPGYEVSRTFPFSRMFGPPGAVHVLIPRRASDPEGTKGSSRSPGQSPSPVGNHAPDGNPESWLPSTARHTATGAGSLRSSGEN